MSEPVSLITSLINFLINIFKGFSSDRANLKIKVLGPEWRPLGLILLGGTQPQKEEFHIRIEIINKSSFEVKLRKGILLIKNLSENESTVPLTRTVPPRDSISVLFAPKREFNSSEINKIVVKVEDAIGNKYFSSNIIDRLFKIGYMVF